MEKFIHLLELKARERVKASATCEQSLEVVKQG